MKIYFAADHAGYEFKNDLVAFVRDELHLEIQDCGATELDPDDDYPGIIAGAARAVSLDLGSGVDSRAIILGGSGQGEAIVANRFKGIRAALYYGGNQDSEEIVRLSREHNDANVLSLGARFISLDQAKSAVRLWLSTPFSQDERHVRRIAQIENVPHE